MQGKIRKLSMSKFLLTPQNLECFIRSVNHTAPGICKQVSLLQKRDGIALLIVAIFRTRVTCSENLFFLLFFLFFPEKIARFSFGMTYDPPLRTNGNISHKKGQQTHLLSTQAAEINIGVDIVKRTLPVY